MVPFLTCLYEEKHHAGETQGDCKGSDENSLPIQSQAFHPPIKKIFIELYCVLDTVFQILGNLFQYIFQVRFPREDCWVEFVQLSISLHPGSCLGLSHQPQRSLPKPTSACLRISFITFGLPGSNISGRDSRWVTAEPGWKPPTSSIYSSRLPVTPLSFLADGGPGTDLQRSHWLPKMNYHLPWLQINWGSSNPQRMESWENGIDSNFISILEGSKR